MGVVLRGVLMALSIAAAGIMPAFAGYHSTVVTVTAYTSTPAQTQGDPYRGAWGNELHPGMHAVAVSPDLIPLGLGNGTKIAIAGFKHDFIVLDKTDRAEHRVVDIYMGNDLKAAKRFGRRRLRIWWHTPD